VQCNAIPEGQRRGTSYAENDQTCEAMGGVASLGRKSWWLSLHKESTRRSMIQRAACRRTASGGYSRSHAIFVSVFATPSRHASHTANGRNCSEDEGSKRVKVHPVLWRRLGPFFPSFAFFSRLASFFTPLAVTCLFLYHYHRSLLTVLFHSPQLAHSTS
jgi:hypothetical protein